MLDGVELKFEVGEFAGNLRVPVDHEPKEILGFEFWMQYS